MASVEAVVSVVIQKFTDLLMRDSNTFNKVKHEMQEVRTMLSEMHIFFKNARSQSYQEGENDEFDKWATDFLETLYRVEYVSLTFALSTIWLRRVGFINKYAFIIKNEFSSCRSLPKDMDDNISTIVALKHSLDSIKKSIEECKSKRPQLKLVTQLQRSTSARGSSNVNEVRQPIINPLPRTRLDSVAELRRARSASESSSQEKERPLISLMRTDTFNVDQEESMIADFKKDVKMLVALLTNKDKHQDIISVFGEGESDKSLLAKTIYNKRKIKDHFEACAWVSIPRNKKEVDRHIVLVILRQFMTITEEQNLRTEILKGKLYECLKDKRYLIVIDDLWAPEIFEELKGSLPAMFNGSRVMFTTSEKDVPSFAHPEKRYKLELNDEGCWNLFLKKVPALSTDPFKQEYMLDLKNKVVTMCKRVPLRVLMLGGLLSTKGEIYEEWRRVLARYESCKLSSPLTHSSDVLIFFYNDLPLHLKPCFLYLALFRKEFEIPVRRLFWLWLAEGFVKGSSASTIPEDLVEGYLQELVNRNMVEISKRRSDGSIKRCRMLGVFHEIFLSKAVDIGLFYIHRKFVPPPPRFGVRRVVEYYDIKHYPSSEFHLQNVQSYLSFNSQKKDTPADEIGKFLCKIIRARGFGLLRVLDLERVYKPSLPEKLGNLINLRYLGLRWTFLDSLPSSVGDLLYLETLDIKHTYITTLPRSIGKMKHLRHLCLNETRLDISSHRLEGGDSLAQLQTLWGLYVDEKSRWKKSLTSIRKLGLTSHSSCFEELSVWISKLSSLQSLRLRSKDEVGWPSDLQLPPLQSLKSLTHLYLLGKLASLPRRNEFPDGLRVLTLSVSQLEDDPMPTLAHLSKLAVLRLLAGSYKGKQMDCPPQGFPSLVVLKIWKLELLEKWTAGEGAMQNLRALEIRCCEKLEEIPNNLLRLSTFEKLILTNMPKEFVKRAQLKRHKNTYVKVNHWDF